MHCTANDFFLVDNAEDNTARESDLKENPREGVFFRGVDVDGNTIEDEEHAITAIVAPPTLLTLPTNWL